MLSLSRIGLSDYVCAGLSETSAALMDKQFRTRAKMGAFEAGKPYKQNKHIGPLNRIGYLAMKAVGNFCHLLQQCNLCKIR